MLSSIRALASFLMAAMAAFALPVAAADIVLTPTAGGGVSISNAAGDATRFRVTDDGTVSMPAVTAVPGTATGLCLEIATGRVGTCVIGTITSIVAGTGLTGGTITASGTIGIADGGVGTAQLANGAVTATKMAANGCTNGQVLQFNGAAWACATPASFGGTVTSVATGTGLTGGPITGSGAISIANGGVGTAQLADASVTGAKLAASGCASGQVLKYNGTAWACAADNDSVSGGVVSGNLTLPPSTYLQIGNIMKGGMTFIHNYGTGNTFIGLNAGNFSMTGVNNTALGASALLGNGTGSQNTAIGYEALMRNTTGLFNTANGNSALTSNTTGDANTAIGRDALRANTIGMGNTAIGYLSLLSNSSGSNNTACGGGALRSNTEGTSNTGIGVASLFQNTTGIENTASGRQALYANTTGNGNTAIGFNALINNVAGNNNIGLGNFAGGSIASGSDNISIGNPGEDESNTIRIGVGVTHTATYIAGINGATSSSGVAVYVNGSGQLGTVTSSEAFKRDIADMADASSALMRLRPVTFRYRPGVDDGSEVLQYGLVAEEVAAVYPGLVARDAEGRVHTVRYQFLPPMLLNEVQKQQRIIASLEREHELQRAEIAALKQVVAEVAELKRHMAHMARMIDSLGPEPQVSAALR